MFHFFRFGDFDGQEPPSHLDGLLFPSISRSRLERIRIAAAIELLGGPLVAKSLDVFMYAQLTPDADSALANEISRNLFPKQSNKAEILKEYLLSHKNPDPQLSLGCSYSLAYLLANSSTMTERAVGQWAMYLPLSPVEKAIIDRLKQALESDERS